MRSTAAHHGLLHDPDRLLALAQRAVVQAQRSADDAPETVEQHALRVAVAMLLDEDPHGVLAAVLGRVSEDGSLQALAVRTVERLAWHLAASLDFDQPDGRVVRQRTFAIPLIVPGDEPVPLRMQRRSDQKALHAIAATLARHGLVREQASVVLMPYLYPAHAMRALTPVKLRGMSVLMRATYGDDAPSFDPNDPRWCCGNDPVGQARAHAVQDADTPGGHPVQLFFLIGAVADEPECADAVFEDPTPSYAAVYDTHLQVWADAVSALAGRWMGVEGVFVSALAAPRDAIDDAARLLPGVHCAMTLEHEMTLHGLAPRALDVVATRHTCALPIPDTVHAVHLEFRLKDRNAKVFDLLWRRPNGADGSAWADELIADVQSMGVTLVDERRERPHGHDVRFDPESLGVNAYVFDAPTRAQ